MQEKTVNALKKDLCGILDDFARKGITDRERLETVKTALSALQKLTTLEAMERVQSGGYSERGGDYERGTSYARDAQGRYTENKYHDGGYSRNERAGRGMQDAGPDEKEFLRRLMEKLN